MNCPNCGWELIKLSDEVGEDYQCPACGTFYFDLQESQKERDQCKGDYMQKKCPKCKTGYLIQLADADRDICYCPICEEIIRDCVAWDTP
jgi:hypothetical protein